jgi:poly-beta-1,6-N-acetyl-D-glucosamine synthase
MYFVAVVYAGIYDIKKALKSHKSVAQSPLTPADLTILIPAYNEELVIERALRNVIEVAPPSTKIFVIDDKSKDSTSKLVKKFIDNHPHPNVTLMSLHANHGKGGALNQALGLVQTELVMVLDADCTLHPLAITRMLTYFSDPLVQGLATHVRISDNPSLLSILQKVEFIVGFHHKKYYDVANSEFIIGGQGSTYRTSAVRNIGGYKSDMQTEDIEVSLSIVGKGKDEARIVYANDVIVYTEAVPTLRGLFRQRYRWKFGAMQAVLHHKNLIFSTHKKHSKLLTWYRLPSLFVGEINALIDPLILLSFSYIAVNSMNAWIFLGSWASFCIYTIVALVLDDYTPRRQKVALCGMVPVLYPFFMLFTIINFLAMIKTMRNLRGLLGREKVSGSWVSPERIGKAHLAG